MPLRLSSSFFSQNDGGVFENQRVPEGLALRRIEASGSMLDLSEPLLFLKHPVVENDQWTSALLTGADPSSGTYGQKISIAGSYFGSERGATILTIGGVEVTDILSWADDKIECLIPSNAVLGPLAISMGAWKSNENIVLHLSAPPEITGVSPSTGTAGGLISIDGKNFGEKKGKVTIGGIKAKLRKGGWMESSIVCTAPEKLGSGTHGITIETPYGSDTLPDAYSIPGQ